MRLLWLDTYTLQTDPVAVDVGEETVDQIDDGFVETRGEYHDSGIAAIAEADEGGPTPYAGNAYYTPIYGTEDFYTPWGESPLDSGLAFLKTSAGAISIIAFLIFVMPFAVSVVGTLIEEIRKEFRK